MLGLIFVFSVFPFIVVWFSVQSNRLPGKTRPGNDLLCVGWDVRPYTLTTAGTLQNVTDSDDRCM